MGRKKKKKLQFIQSSLSKYDKRFLNSRPHFREKYLFPTVFNETETETRG